MKILGVMVSYGFVFGAFAVLATKVFYPHHRLIAGLLYGVSWIIFVWAFWARRQEIFASGEATSSFFVTYAWLFFFGLIFASFLYLYFILTPPSQSPLAVYSDEELIQYLADDRRTFSYIDRRLEDVTSQIETDELFLLSGSDLSRDTRQRVKDVWKEYFDLLFELDILKQRYKSFYQIGHLQDDKHQQSFLLAYNAFLAQNHFALRMQKTLHDRDDILAVLNDVDPARGLPGKAYDTIVSRLSSPEEIARLNAGRAYLAILPRTDEEDVLVSLADRRLQFIDENLEQYTYLVFEKPLKLLEQGAFAAWFPLQKNLAIEVSYLRTANRDYLISQAFASERRLLMEPGDILLERREWHATNVGIPGYWTHSAFYIGTPDDLDTYFGDLPVLGGQKPRDVLAGLYPETYAIYLTKKQGAYPMSVIEAKRPGVILMSFEHSVNADALSVLRPQVSKAEKWRGILAAFSYYGRGYDYNFDFRTDNDLVCSELVYKAYEDTAITFETTELNGRPLFSPNNFVEKFAREYGTEDAELEFVLFWDGNEKTRTVKDAPVEDFLTSHKRPKWHIIKDHLR